MAIGKASDFIIYEDEFYTGMTEVQAQQADAFNGASAGAIRLSTEFSKGDYKQEAFFKAISSLVTRRDTTSVSAATDLAMTSDEEIMVKINRKIGPVANTLDSLRKIASNPSEFSLLLGQQIGKAVSVDYVNSAIRAANAAISGVTSKNYDYSATGTTNYTALINTLAKMGDAQDRIAAWVMHSKSFFDLMGDAIKGSQYESVADKTIYMADVGTLGRPVIVTDDASLVNTTPIPDNYYVLGLVEGAVTVQESEGREIVTDTVTGLENLVVRIQGEHAYNLGVKGFKWDVANGGANPADATVATATNWDQVASDDKDTAGVRLTAQ
jgi:hypothetical protein